MNLFRLCVANLVALFWVVIPTAMEIGRAHV